MVVAEVAAAGEPTRPRAGVDGGELAADVARVPPEGEPAYGVGDVAWGQPARRHLVKQRLERAVEVLVDHGDPEARLPQLAYRGQAREAGPDDHDVRSIAHVADPAFLSLAAGSPRGGGTEACPPPTTCPSRPGCSSSVDGPSG